MKKLLGTVVALVIGASTASAGAISIQGSDTLETYTKAVFQQCGALVTPLPNTIYGGGGSTTGEDAIDNGLQQIAPMSRFLDQSSCVSTAPGLVTKTEGLNVALDALNIVAADSSTNTCAGIRFNGVENPGDANGDGVSSPSYDFGAISPGWRNALRILWAGMHVSGNAIANKDCNSDIRHYLANNWSEMFDGGCSGTTDNCSQVKRVWRRADLSGTTDTFLSLLGLPGVTSEPFCNGNELMDEDPIRRDCDPTDEVCSSEGDLGLVQAIYVEPFISASIAYPSTTCSSSFARFAARNNRLTFPTIASTCPEGVGPFFGQCVVPVSAASQPNCQKSCAGGACDAGGILSPLAGGRRVCQVDGDVQKVCTVGNRTCGGVAGGTACTTQNDCPGGIDCKRLACETSKDCGTLGAECVVETCPGTQRVCTDAGATGRFCSANTVTHISTCPSGSDSTCVVSKVCENNPATLCTTDAQCGGVVGACKSPTRCNAFDDSDASCSVVRPDARSYNKRLWKADGTLEQSPAPSSIQVTNSVYRIRQAGGVCDEASATRQIGCLAGEVKCTLGFAGREASEAFAATVGLDVNGIEPSVANVQTLKTNPAAQYPLARELYVNTMRGFETVIDGTFAGFATEERSAAECMVDPTSYPALGGDTINAYAVAEAGFIDIPGGLPVCVDYDESNTSSKGCSAGTNVDACANNAGTDFPADCSAFCAAVTCPGSRPNCRANPGVDGTAVPLGCGCFP